MYKFLLLKLELYNFSFLNVISELLLELEPFELYNFSFLIGISELLLEFEPFAVYKFLRL